ncbi:MAG: HNH endonuclease [Planctomycetota bacterium]|jgi:hypothetical protein
MYDRRKALPALHEYLDTKSQPGKWIWTGPKNNRGYGMIRIPGYKQPQLVNRVVHWLHVDPVPPEWEVDHKDGDINNVIPCNLEAVPKDENMRRAAKRGSFRGERNGNSKLTEELVSFIKLLYYELDYTQKAISEETGVNCKTVSNVCRGRNWKHVSVDWIPKPEINLEQNRIETV